MKKILHIMFFPFFMATVLCLTASFPSPVLSSTDTSTLAPIINASKAVEKYSQQDKLTIFRNPIHLAEIIATDLGTVEKLSDLIEDMRYDGFGIVISPKLSSETKAVIADYFLYHQDGSGLGYATRELYNALVSLRKFLNTPKNKQPDFMSLPKPKTDNATTMAWALANELMQNGEFLPFIEELWSFDIGTMYSKFISDKTRHRLFWYFKRNYSRRRLKKATKELQTILNEIYLAYYEKLYPTQYHEDYILTAA